VIITEKYDIAMMLNDMKAHKILHYANYGIENYKYKFEKDKNKVEFVSIPFCAFLLMGDDEVYQIAMIF
jgi:hypothetical protein